LAGISFLEKKDCAFVWCLVLSKKYTKSFGGKIVLRKKGCAFKWCQVLSQKYTKSFGGKNLALCALHLSQ